MKLELNKKQLISLIMAFAIGTSMTACKKEEKNVPTTTTTTTIETTVESTETTPVETTVVEEAINYDVEANNFYEANKNNAFFVNQYGEDKEKAVKEIRDILLILSNRSETITNEDLRNAFYAMDNIFMPTNVIQAAGNYMTEEPVENVENVPNVGRYVMDSQARQIINDNTAIVNNFINAMNNGTKEEIKEAEELLKKRVIVIERNLDEFYYLGELSNADELALNISIKGLVNLAGSLCKNGVLNYTDNNGVDQTIFLIADTRGAAILNTFRFAEEDGAPFDTKIIKKDGEEIMVNGRFVEYLGKNGFTKEFITQAEKNTIEDTLAITKYDEAIKYLENEFSQLSAEYYALNSDCNTNTLTR